MHVLFTTIPSPYSHRVRLYTPLPRMDHNQCHLAGVAAIDYESWPFAWEMFALINLTTPSVYVVSSVALVRAAHPTWNESMLLSEARNQWCSDIPLQIINVLSPPNYPLVNSCCQEQRFCDFARKYIAAEYSIAFSRAHSQCYSPPQHSNISFRPKRCMGFLWTSRLLSYSRTTR